MKLKFNKFNKSDISLWGQHTIFWEVEVVDYDFQPILDIITTDDSVWGHFFDRKRLALNLKDERYPIFNDLDNNIKSLKDDIFDSIYADSESYIRGLLYRGKDFYKEHAQIGTQIFKDLPGFKMYPHLDNQHIIFQIVINITENETGTGFFKPMLSDETLGEVEPYYIATGEKNKGILFSNNIMAPHGIDGVNRDRYILYSSITIGGNEK